MRFFEERNAEYILAYGIGVRGGDRISEERYQAILAAAENRPPDTETLSYRLRTDLSWDPVAVDIAEDEIDESEAYSIIFGGTE